MNLLFSLKDNKNMKIQMFNKLRFYSYLGRSGLAENSSLSMNNLKKSKADCTVREVYFSNI